jgi:hypothetical protein
MLREPWMPIGKLVRCYAFPKGTISKLSPCRATGQSRTPRANERNQYAPLLRSLAQAVGNGRDRSNTVAHGELFQQNAMLPLLGLAHRNHTLANINPNIVGSMRH